MVKKKGLLASVFALGLAVASSVASVASADPPGNSVTGAVSFPVRAVCAIHRPNGSQANQFFIGLSSRADARCPSLIVDTQRSAVQRVAIGDVLYIALTRNPRPGAGTYTLGATQAAASAMASAPPTPTLPSGRAPTPEELAAFQAAMQRMVQGQQNAMNAAGGMVSGVIVLRESGALPWPASADLDATVEVRTFGAEVEGTFTIRRRGQPQAQPITGTFRVPLTVDPRGD